jgi:starvation-inducible DNA-binding protein
MSKVRALEPQRKAADALDTPTDLSHEAVKEISQALNALLADTFALYLKTKNFHWHVSGPHFRDYHLLLDEQGEQIFAITDDIAERARKIGAPRCARSAISPSSSASLTTTRNSFLRSTCCAS